MFSMQCFQDTQSLSNISAARPKPRQLSITRTASGSSDSAAMGNQVGAMCNKQSHAANQEQSEMATYQVQNQSSNHQQGQNMLPTNQVIDLTKHLSDNPEWYSLGCSTPGCTSWIWITRTRQPGWQTCRHCGQHWAKSWVDKGGPKKCWDPNWWTTTKDPNCMGNNHPRPM